MLNISFQEQNIFQNEAVVWLLNENIEFDQSLIEIDKKYNGIISKTLNKEHKFTGKFGDHAHLTVLDDSDNIFNIIIYSIGDEGHIEGYKIEEIGGKILQYAKSAKISSISINLNKKIGQYNESEAAAYLASGALLSAYQYDKYFTKKTEHEKFAPSELMISVKNIDEAYAEFEKKKALAMGVYLARDLVSEVANILYPETYSEIISEKLSPLNIDVEILGEREMRDLGMGALLGVGQGSNNESKMVIMKYMGAKDSSADPVCLVGKGVTFDTGGISLKPAAGMPDMKYDMAGSAAVVGTIKALALRKANVNVVGVVGLVENMPGGSAQRPGDVVKTMSGQTVEVLNTDAEGRLVLCDCMTYVQQNFEPKCIIDLATLTGAIVVSLAHTYAGLFCNDDGLAENLVSSAHKVNEKLWRMPLHKDYDDMLKSEVADIANIGNEKGAAGSSTAAHFIGRFVEEGVKWAHLDIAGMAWDKKGKNPISPKGAVGFGVRLLNQFIKDHYE